MWTDVLASAGVQVRGAQRDQVQLAYQDQIERFWLHRRARAPRPDQVRAPAHPHSILTAPTLSKSTRAQLRRLGWSYVSDDGQAHLRFAQRDLDLPSTSDASSQPTLQTHESPEFAEPPESTAPQAGLERPVRNDLPGLRVRGSGAFAVLRALLQTAAGQQVRQVDLAEQTGLSQPRVSQLLAALRAAGVVDGSRARWQVREADRALQLWLAGYPGPGGTTTHWAGLEAMWPTTLALLPLLGHDTLVSGDAGADLLAPWRRPRRAVLYARSLPDLVDSGLVQTESAELATVSICVPDDASIWLGASTRTHAGRTLAVPGAVQVMWDVLAEGGVDVEQAAAALGAAAARGQAGAADAVDAADAASAGA